MGSTVNTNAAFISNELLKIGVESSYHTAVDDNVDRMKEVFDIAYNRANVIIITGGLGPTQDDLTKETLAYYLGLGIFEDEDMAKEIMEKFRANKRSDVPSNNFKQAVRIEGSEFLENKVGTAPGIYLKYDNRKIFLLPGPPQEMTYVFEKEAIPKLINKDHHIVIEAINIRGIGESGLELSMRDIVEKYPDLEIATYSNINSIEVKVIARGTDKDLLKEEVNRFINEMQERYNKYIFGYNNDPIEEIVLDLLREKNKKIAFAESCTGGLIASTLVKYSGASDILDRAFVTYSNESKNQILEVKKETLYTFGAVSKETSEEMVRGLLKKSEADIGLSITGIAGPKSDDTDKPVGLVYMSIYDKKHLKTFKYNFKGSRHHIQNRAVENAYHNLKEFITKYID